MQSVGGALVGQMEIDHRGVDLFVTQEFLDGVQVRPGLQQVRCEGMAQRMHRGGRDVEVFAGDDQKPLQGAVRHGALGAMHSSGQGLGIAITAADIGKDQHGMAVESPVTAQFVVQGGGQRNDTIFVILTVADDQFVFRAENVVDGQAQAFAQTQAAAVDELERRAIAAQADVSQ